MCIRDSFFGAKRREDVDGVGCFIDEINSRRHRDETRKVSDCLLYTSDAADERSSVDLGGRRLIKKKQNGKQRISTDVQAEYNS